MDASRKVVGPDKRAFDAPADDGIRSRSPLCCGLPVLGKPEFTH